MADLPLDMGTYTHSWTSGLPEVDPSLDSTCLSLFDAGDWPHCFFWCFFSTGDIEWSHEVLGDGGALHNEVEVFGAETK